MAYYDNCYLNGYGQTVCDRSGWYTWGRWVLLGCVVAAAILVFFLISCLSAKRRRRAGNMPYRGTGWTLGMTPTGHAPARYTAQPYYANQPAQQQQPYYNNSNNPPPAYSPPPNTYYGNRDGQNIELQQPGATYQGYPNGEQYAPPKDPPPRK